MSNQRMSYQVDPPLRELIAAVLNGEATAEQQAQLATQLQASETARDFYLDYVNMHSELRRLFLTSPEEVVIAVTADELAEFRRAAALESFPASRRWWQGQPILWTIMTIAMVLTIAIVWRTWNSSSAGAVATLRSLDGKVTLVTHRVSRTAAVGDALRPGDFLQVGSEGARAVMEYPDGTRIHLHSDAVVQSPADQAVRLELLAGSIEVDAAKQPADAPLIFATRHSRYVVLGTRFRLYQEQEATRLELDEGKVRLERPTSGEAREIEAGSVAITTDEQSPIEVLPLATGRAQLLHTLRKAGQKVDFTNDDRLLTSSWQTGLQLWQLDDFSLAAEYRPDAGYSEGLSLTSDGQIVQVNRHGYVLAWRPGATNAIKIPLVGKHTRSRALSPDGRAAVESSQEGTTIYQVDVAAQKLIQQLHLPPSGKAWCLSLTPEGNQLAAGFWDGTVNVYAVPSGEVRFTRRLQHTPTHLDLSADGQRLVVATQRDGLILLDLSSGEQSTLWPPGANIVRCLRFSQDGRKVLAGLNDRTARMWSVADGRQLLVVEAGYSPQGIAWLEEKQILATADGAVKLWQCTFEVATSAEAP